MKNLSDLSIADVFALHKIAESQEKTFENAAFKATTFEQKADFQKQKKRWIEIGHKCSAELLSRVNDIYELNPTGVVKNVLERETAIERGDWE